VPLRIREAAGRLFQENGFSATSVRQIAAAAQTDPGIVLRHFTSKEQLFLHTMVVDYGDRNLVEGPIDGLGRALLKRLFEDIDPSVPPMFRALADAADRPKVRAYIEEANSRHIVQPLVSRLEGDDAAVRAHLVGTCIRGLLSSLWVNEDEALVSVPLAQVLDAYGSALQALITPAHPVREASRPHGLVRNTPATPPH
jgi:AcrR family transcriptional regulator